MKPSEHHIFCVAGSLLASGSDDMRVCLWDLQSSKPATVISTGHSQNIFCAKFMPGSSGKHPLSFRDCSQGTLVAACSRPMCPSEGAVLPEQL